MLKIFHSNWFWLFLATCLICFAMTLFASWVLMVGIWFSLFFAFRLTKLEAKLPEPAHKLFLSVVLIYPLAETAVKWALSQNMIANSWWLNRLEHTSWALATTILFLPTLINLWQQLSWWQNLVILVGLLCLIGNLNEFFEYWMRAKDGIVDYYKFSQFYPDTIYDMMVNILGAALGFVLLKVCLPNNSQT